MSKSLAEEEIADNLMTQLARELMSESQDGDDQRSPSGHE